MQTRRRDGKTGKTERKPRIRGFSDSRMTEGTQNREGSRRDQPTRAKSRNSPTRASISFMVRSTRRWGPNFSTQKDASALP